MANLSATGTDIVWYSTPLGLTQYQLIDIVVNGTHYYAEQTISGCKSATRLDVTATVNSTPSAPTGSAAQSFCAGATVANLSATGSGIQWYAAAMGGSPLDPSTPLVGMSRYYASQTVDGCESSARLEVTAYMNIPMTPLGNSSQTLCVGSTVADLHASANGELLWFAASSGGSALPSSTPLVSGDHYYAGALLMGCSSPVRLDVTVTLVAIRLLQQGLQLKASVQEHSPQWQIWWQLVAVLYGMMLPAEEIFNILIMLYPMAHIIMPPKLLTVARVPTV